MAPYALFGVIYLRLSRLFFVIPENELTRFNYFLKRLNRADINLKNRIYIERFINTHRNFGKACKKILLMELIYCPPKGGDAIVLRTTSCQKPSVFAVPYRVTADLDSGRLKGILSVSVSAYSDVPNELFYSFAVAIGLTVS